MVKAPASRGVPGASPIARRGRGPAPGARRPLEAGRSTHTIGHQFGALGIATFLLFPKIVYSETQVVIKTFKNNLRIAPQAWKNKICF